jgi:two-component system cell cycle sensor histidine kinase/response regulator CckA
MLRRRQGASLLPFSVRSGDPSVVSPGPGPRRICASTAPKLSRSTPVGFNRTRRNMPRGGVDGSQRASRRTRFDAKREPPPASPGGHRWPEEVLIKAFEASPEPVSISRLADGTFLDVNQAFLRATGYERGEVMGQSAQALGFRPLVDDAAKLVGALQRGPVRDWEVVFLTKSGQKRTGLMSAELVGIDGEACLLAIIKDTTVISQLEQQLLQAQKLEHLGRLTGGVVHDFNNLLTSINGYCELVLERMPSGDPLARHIREIRKAGDRAASLTRRLLAFIRRQALAPQMLDLNVVVANMADMLSRLVSENIELIIVAAPGLWPVRADPGHIEEVIMNLVLNARDAMPQGGKVTLETANVRLDESDTRHHAMFTPGRYVMLAVSDTGIGMDAQTQSHIFEPFFTTKEPGKGTGLGLATVHGIVKENRGCIQVRSEPGKGATFKVFFPCPDKET